MSLIVEFPSGDPFLMGGSVTACIHVFAVLVFQWGGAVILSANGGHLCFEYLPDKSFLLPALEEERDRVALSLVSCSVMFYVLFAFAGILCLIC